MSIDVFRFNRLSLGSFIFRLNMLLPILIFLGVIFILTEKGFLISLLISFSVNKLLPQSIGLLKLLLSIMVSFNIFLVKLLLPISSDIYLSFSFLFSLLIKCISIIVGSTDVLLNDISLFLSDVSDNLSLFKKN